MAIAKEVMIKNNAVINKIAAYPRMRYMGSKYKIIPTLVEVFSDFNFNTALDGFSGSGIVSYALKTMGKTVHSNDYLNFPIEIAKATTGNPGLTAKETITELLETVPVRKDFIQTTFNGLYFGQEDHRFLDHIWTCLPFIDDPYQSSLVIASMCLASVRKQNRGVFTVTDLRYDDGRRDLQLSMKEQFYRALQEYENVAFDDGHLHTAGQSDVFDITQHFDLVYFDPPYMPKSDDNDYVKRYHFLEGLSKYWVGETIRTDTKTRKIPKKPTRFGNRSHIAETFYDLFKKYADSTIVLSYSSNGLPTLDVLTATLREFKPVVEVVRVPHRYSFGTHENVGTNSNLVEEYIIIGAEK